MYSPSDSSTLDVIRREVESIESFLTRRERGEADEEEIEDEDEDEDEDDPNGAQRRRRRRRSPSFRKMNPTSTTTFKR